MNPKQPVNVHVMNRRTRKNPRLEFHLVGDSKICNDRSWSVATHFVATAISFVQHPDSCYTCRRSLARELDSMDEVFVFDTLEDELDSPFGRPAAQILMEEGLVPKAAKKFGRRYPDIVSGLSSTPLNNVLDVVTKEGWTQTVYVICPKCDERVSGLGDWPKVQGVVLKCPQCNRKSSLDFDEYSPRQAVAEQHLDELSDPSDHRAKLVDVIDHAFDIEPAKNQQVDVRSETDRMYVYRSEKQYTAHRVIDDEIKCGSLRRSNLDTFDVYKLDHLRLCKNCKRVIA